MTRIVSSIFIAATLCAVAGAPGAAKAESTYPAASIRTADLDLSSESGIETFRGRVKAAANRICGTDTLREFEELRARAECKAHYSRSAEAQLGRIGVQEVRGTR